MGNKTNVIFTGLFRNINLLKKSVGDLLSLKKKGLVDKIIFSTWDYEVEKNKKIVSFLRRNKIIILSNEEPEDRGIGNIFCQMKALNEGLKVAGKNSFVLKTRSDLYINKKFLENLFRNKEKLLKIRKTLPGGNVFSYKIWIPYFEITSPFHMADECFYGNHQDISYLVNFEDYYNNLKLHAGVVHIQRHIHPFIEKFKEIRNFFEKNSDVGFPRDESNYYKLLKKISKNSKLLTRILDTLTVRRRFIILNKRLKDELYLNSLAIYYSILYSHFYINNEPINNLDNNKGIFNRNIKPEKDLSDKEIVNNFVKNRISVITKGQIYSFNETFLRNIFEDKSEQKNTSGHSLMDAVDRFNSSAEKRAN